MTEQTQDSHKKKRSWLKLIGLGFGYLFGTLIVVGVIAHYYWKQSGDGEWHKHAEIDGNIVYTLKKPGEVYQKFKLIGTFEGRLSSIMKVMRDPEACEEVGCFDYKILKEESYPRYIYYTFKYPMPSPFKDRQYVVKSEFFQNPETKAIYADYKYTDYDLPADECCVRVQHMHNIWQFQPLGDGQVRVEFIMNERPGGMFPYPLFNLAVGGSMAQNIPLLQDILNLDKYKDAVIDYVQEYSE
ncbi:MAG: hypothetical protein ACFHVJ_00885 [Aestuariibacter sp.]